MKALIIIALLCPVMAHAQSIDSMQAQVKQMRLQMYESGKSMRQFKTAMQVGIGMQVIGGALAGLGATEKKSTLTIVGGAVGVFGFIAMFAGYNHIGKAGIHLQGSGVNIDLKRSGK